MSTPPDRAAPNGIKKSWFDRRRCLIHRIVCCIAPDIWVGVKLPLKCQFPIGGQAGALALINMTTTFQDQYFQIWLLSG